MVRKKMEGDEDQRRAAARQAERAGELPAGRQVTTGGSKQRTHVPGNSALGHEERIEPLHRGKQREEAAEIAAERAIPPPPPPAHDFRGRGRPGYDEEHARVFQALADAERRHDGEGVYATEVARSAGLPAARTRELLHDLVSVHRLATELQRTDTPDQGPRYETKPGR